MVRFFASVVLVELGRLGESGGDDGKKCDRRGSWPYLRRVDLRLSSLGKRARRLTANSMERPHHFAIALHPHRLVHSVGFGHHHNDARNAPGGTRNCV